MTSLGIDIGGSAIKCAVVRDGQTLITRKSKTYHEPDRAQLIDALKQILQPADFSFDAVGLCVPGLLDRESRRITASINVPGLVGQSLDQLLIDVLRIPCPAVKFYSDAQAAAFDLYHSRNLQGRLLVLVLGTGVGAAVWDKEGPLCIDGDSPGHFGQIDVTLDTPAPVGPDGGQGSLEAYIGAPALRRQFGEKFYDQITDFAIDSLPLRALTRAIRIAHGIYRPHHVCLAGAIGNAMRPLIDPLREQINTNLTRIARPGWTMSCGTSAYHAAICAARWAAR